MAIRLYKMRDSQKEKNLVKDILSLSTWNEEEMRMQPVFNLARNTINDTRFHHLKSSEDKMNIGWKRPTFWEVPENKVKIKLKRGSENLYEFPVFVSLNEKFINHVRYKEPEYHRDFVGELSREKLKGELLKHEMRISDASHRFKKKIDLLREEIINHIDNNKVEVKEYEPHTSGTNTQKMEDLIEYGIFVFRGVVCGSIYAYERIITDYLDDDKLLKQLRNLTTEIVDYSKKYFSLQVSLNNHVNPGAGKLSTEEIKWIDNIITDLYSLPRESKRVRNYFKSIHSDFKGEPEKDYFRGGLSTSLFCRSISEIYDLTYEPKKISSKRLKQIFKKDIESLRVD